MITFRALIGRASEEPVYFRNARCRGLKCKLAGRASLYRPAPPAINNRTSRGTAPAYSGRAFTAGMVLVALLHMMASGAEAQAPPTQDDRLVVKPPPVSTGVIPLPQGAPPTGPQGRVPAPALPIPKSDQPLLYSPNLTMIQGFVETHTITLEEAVAIALYTNRNLAGSLAALQRAQGRTGQARSALNPSWDASANLMEFDAPTTATFGAGAGGAPSMPIVLNPQFNPILSTRLSLPIDLSGTLHAAASQAQFQEVAARIDINRVRNLVVYDVKNAFYSVLRAQEQVAVATDNLNNSLNRLSDANKNYAAGTAPRFDVITAQRDVADAQQSLINARAQVSVDLAALKNTIGIDIKSRLRISNQNAVDYPPGVLPPSVPPVTVTGAPGGKEDTPPVKPPVGDTPPTPDPKPAPPNPAIRPLPLPATDEAEETFDLGPEFDALLKEAVQTRPEILESEAQIAAARKGIQYARRSSLPSVNVSLGYVYTPNATAFTRVQQGEAVLGVTLPILDGGLARERVREARADAASAEVNRRQAVDQAQLDVQQAYVTLVQARSRVAVANVGLAQAREAYRLARVRYNAGVSQQTGISPQLELSNSQAGLVQAQTSQINALYDYNLARALLDRAVGRYSFTGTAPGYASPPPPQITGKQK